jgi:hypothetical protein
MSELGFIKVKEEIWVDYAIGYRPLYHLLVYNDLSKTGIRICAWIISSFLVALKVCWLALRQGESG